MKRLLSIITFALIVTSLSATETKIIVRAKAKDAKFIGSSLGGAYVIIKDKLTGQILARGKTEGSTGNTKLIMSTPKERYLSIADEKTAKFEASIDIDEPTFVRIEVYSPISNKQARVNASTELWLIPGKHILGDGVILEISGFIIDILEPRTHHYIALDEIKDDPFKIRANMVMMCGCTINKNGLWDSEKFEVKAIVKRNGDWLTDVSMAIVSTNLFEGSFDLKQPGQYEITLYAYDEQTGNTGVDKVNYVIYD